MPEKISTTTILRRLHSIRYRYETEANKIVLTHNQMMSVDIVKKWICNKIDMDQVIYTDECKFTLDCKDFSSTRAKNINNR